MPIAEVENKLDLKSLGSINLKFTSENQSSIVWGNSAAVSWKEFQSSLEGLKIQYGIDLSGIKNSFYIGINNLVLTSILIAIVSAAFAMYLGRLFFVRPIEQLKEFASDLSRGAPPSPISNKSITIELQELTDKITDMAKAIDQRERALADSNLELKRNQDTLIQAEKMAGLGQVTAGIAHEINNPIGFIMNNLSMLKEYHDFLKQLVEQLLTLMNSLTEDEKTSHSLEIKHINEILAKENLDFVINDLESITSESIDGAKRVKDIAQGLKGYSHSGEQKSQVNINDCIESTLKMVWNELKYNCQIIKELKEIPDIECIGGQVNQVLMNLFVNAAHAMKGKQGELRIQTFAYKNDVHIIVSDNGCGIKRDHLKSIFEPFFTTKPLGEGTGLGISICHDIIKQHGGTIQVESEEGFGSSFMITLPISQNA